MAYVSIYNEICFPILIWSVFIRSTKLSKRTTKAGMGNIV